MAMFVSESKKKTMATFYDRCQEKGYTDMTDPDQSLQAKVIARDLKLNFDDIADFYEQAKAYHKDVKANEFSAQQYAKEQEEKRAVNGIYLFSAVTDEKEKRCFSQYRRPDGSLYYTIDDGNKIEGVLTFSVYHHSETSSYVKPSETVFTAATVGGITTGGFHETGPSVKSTSTHTGKGEIKVNGSHIVHHFLFPTEVCNRFKHDRDFNILVKNGRMTCVFDSKSKNLLGVGTFKAGDIATALALSQTNRTEQLQDYHNCKIIVKIVRDIINGIFPPTDDQLYNQASALVESNKSAEVKKGIEIFEMIGGFLDASDRAKAAKAHYPEVVQREKEEAVVRYEKRRKAVKDAKFTSRLIVNLFITLFMVLATIGGYFGISSNQLSDPDSAFTGIIGMSVCAALSLPGISGLVRKMTDSRMAIFLRWAIVIIVYFVFAIMVSNQLPQT